MSFAYNIIIRFYGFILRVFSIWNTKAKLWVKGRKNWQSNLSKVLGNKENIHWFHCASLGEFEQARPLIEKLKKESPERLVLLTFFSPSGYEIKKDYELADYVSYLPLDTPRNARVFISCLSLAKVYFVKYEVWPNYFKELKKQKIPFYLISATFREDQFYFKSSGRWFKNLLTLPTKIFVQNKESKTLLKTHGIETEVAGDTRYDTVMSNADKAILLPRFEEFSRSKFTLVLGSSWEPEEEIISSFTKKHRGRLNVILAPHDISDSHINSTLKILGDTISTVRYSQLTDENSLTDYDCIVIDNIGMLSNLYQYGDTAFIGGGYTNALHNILEPATFGIPVLFGTNHDKFHEAKEMVQYGGGIEVENYQEFEKELLKLIDNKEELLKKSALNKQFIEERGGATTVIYNSTLRD